MPVSSNWKMNGTKSSLPLIQCIKSKLLSHMWDHFINHFNPDNSCSLHSLSLPLFFMLYCLSHYFYYFFHFCLLFCTLNIIFISGSTKKWCLTLGLSVCPLCFNCVCLSFASVLRSMSESLQ